MFKPVEGGYEFDLGEKGTIIIPTGFHPGRDIDPLAMHCLEELYAGDAAEAEFLGFKQKGAIVQAPTHQVAVASSGLYLMRLTHPESGYDGVQFVRIMWLDQIYRGTRREPYIRVEHTIDIPEALDGEGVGALVLSPSERTTYADMVRDTFLKTLELLP